MLAEAAALITLHCTAAVRDFPAMGTASITATVDYGRGYAYVAGNSVVERAVFHKSFEASSLGVTPGAIQFQRQDLGAVVLDRATINRSTGRLHMVFRSPLFVDASGFRSGLRVIEGDCVPGELVAPPKSAF